MRRTTYNWSKKTNRRSFLLLIEVYYHKYLLLYIIKYYDANHHIFTVSRRYDSFPAKALTTWLCALCFPLVAYDPIMGGRWCVWLFTHSIVLIVDLHKEWNLYAYLLIKRGQYIGIGTFCSTPSFTYQKTNIKEIGLNCLLFSFSPIHY